MTTVVPELPAEVMEALGPVFDALAAEVRANVVEDTRQKAREAGRVALVRNTDSGYRRGFERIMADAFGPQAQADSASAPVTTSHGGDEDGEEEERQCECDSCTDQTCQGECDQCEDRYCEQCHGDHTTEYDCSVCHDIRRCCGYCDTCIEHHDGEDTEGDRCYDCQHCRECDHYCS